MAPIHCTLFSIFLTFLATPNAQPPYPYTLDLPSLLSFKSSAGTRNAGLRTWVGTDPCSGSWAGVRCVGQRVASVVLDDSSLAGSIDSLLQLTQLQVLSLRRNSLTGPLPTLSNFTNPRLRFLLLSHNQFNGTLNISLPSLVSLRLDDNGFSGGLDGLQIPGIEDFNVSGNLLSGEIPFSLSNFSNSAFGGNLDLCGPPVLNSTSAIPSPTPPPAPACCGRSLTKIGAAAILAIGVGDVVVVAVVLSTIVGMYVRFVRKHALISLAVAAGRKTAETDGLGLEEKTRDGGRGVGAGLVCFEGGEDLKLECLLKASAEVLGKGTVGSTYKAVLEDGLMFAVKRVDIGRFRGGGEDFDQQMHVVGTLRHENVVSLRAFYSTSEEKLLIYDYMPNGSLRSLLQNKNGGTNVLDWRSRKQILMGAAQGLNSIHTFPSRRPLVHGNIKPSNVLIDEQGITCVSEWGLMHLITPNTQPSSSLPYSDYTAMSGGSTSASMPNWRGYRAPELTVAGTKATQASDVYSFGMVVLDVVTDKEIEDTEWEEEVMGMVKIGLMCTEERPEQRPKMSQIVRMINEML